MVVGFLGYWGSEAMGSFARLAKTKKLRHYVMLRLGNVTEREMVFCYERVQGLSGNLDMDYSDAGEYLIRQAFEAAVELRNGEIRGEDVLNDEESDSSSEDAVNDGNDRVESESESETSDDEEENRPNENEEGNADDVEEEEEDEDEEEEEEEEDERRGNQRNNEVPPQGPGMNARFFAEFGMGLQEILLQQLILESINQNHQGRQQGEEQNEGPIVEEIFDDEEIGEDPEMNNEHGEDNGQDNNGDDDDPNIDEVVIDEILSEDPEINGEHGEDNGQDNNGDDDANIEVIVMDSNSISDVDWLVCYNPESNKQITSSISFPSSRFSPSLRSSPSLQSSAWPRLLQPSLCSLLYWPSLSFPPFPLLSSRVSLQRPFLSSQASLPSFLSSPPPPPPPSPPPLPLLLPLLLHYSQ